MPTFPLPSIIIIDDDCDDLELLSSALRDHGFDIKCYQDSDIACRELQKIEVYTDLPALIIVDFNMPKMNGEDVLKTLKESPKLRHIPVVLYSTTISAAFSFKLMSMGATLTMLKARNYKEFTAQVTEFQKIAMALRVVEKRASSIETVMVIPPLAPIHYTRRVASLALTLRDKHTAMSPSALPTGRPLEPVLAFKKLAM